DGIARRIEAEFEFPVLIRSVGTHRATALCRVDNAEGLRRAMPRFARWPCYVIQFHESRHRSGNFLMYRAVFIGGVFMGGLTSLSSDSGISRKLGKGFGLLAILYGLVLFLGALSGGSNPLKPLASISVGTGGATVAESQHLQFTRIKSVDDLDREVAAAAAAGKSAMLDFYADWCVSCLEMEEYTFITPVVQAALANTVVLQADVTRNDAEDKALLERFGVFGPPTIIFFGNDGKERVGYEVVGFMKAEDFAKHITLAFDL
ncbi:MAG: thioredoxin family protein, partial [Proteobacteria bacterium]|nr:thioredoxin family protein [Pseudomonadota bacterium]